MAELVKSATEFMAAILSTLGFVGRARRRSNIHLDLKLLDELRATPEFGSESVAATLLIEHVTTEVAKLTGALVKRKRKINWASMFVAAAMGVPAGYFAKWGSLPTAASIVLYVFAGLMAVSVLGMLLPEAEADSSGSDDGGGPDSGARAAGPVPSPD